MYHITMMTNPAIVPRAMKSISHRSRQRRLIHHCLLVYPASMNINSASMPGGWGLGWGTLPQNQTPFRFLDLPAEIRNQIYSEVLCTANSRHEPSSESPPEYRFSLGILRANRQVYHEAKNIFLDNVFIKITIPWPEAISHIQNEGKVSTVATGKAAEACQNFYLQVAIDSAESPPLSQSFGDNVISAFSIITTLEDLSAFAQVWQFSNLEHVLALNPHLQLDLNVKDPRDPSRPVPKSVQERLLLPFGVIKDLYTLSFQSAKGLLPLDSAVIDALKKAQRTPEPTPEQCIERALALKDEGNRLVVAEKSYRAALKKYNDAFAAIHISVKGRDRTIHCTGYYVQTLHSGSYKGFDGHFARLIVRIQLVANIVHTCLKLEEWAEAYFWGKRSITLFWNSMSSNITDEGEIGGPGWDSFIAETSTMGFRAHDEMGKIIYRTGLAARKVDEPYEARVLIQAAARYLPREESVQKDFKALQQREAEIRGHPEMLFALPR